ncbi:hypothetical protein [Dyadobacter sp. 3J3]|uniref:hypothetical protein n=1 Tax=Dyadobacter sp. 3J3 TaxID=2606600 RepID=UPI00135C1E66|nr:hypothetical protein [Dyadobacter sp. 3J3]
MLRTEATINYNFEVIGKKELQSLIIVYRLPDGVERKYEIPVPGIGDTQQDTRESLCINHLYNKSWVSVNMLYDLAKKINKLSPDNDISWFKTFLVVENYHLIKANKYNQEITELVTERLKKEKLI